MSAEEKKKFDPGFIKNARNVAILIGIAITVVVVMFMAMKARNKKAPPMDVPPIDMRAGVQQASENERYSQVLAKTNKDGFKQATQDGGTFIPALSDRDAKTTELEKDLQQRVDSQPDKRIDYARPNNTGGQGTQSQQGPVPVAAGLQQQLDALVNAWSGNSQQVLGLAKTQQQAQAPTPTAAQSQQPGMMPAQTAQANQAVEPYISATDIVGANLLSAIDTDDPSSEAIAEVDSGKYAGARFMGTAKLVNEVVTIDFSTMRLPKSLGGRTVKITARAVTEDDLKSGLPAKIDNRYGQRVGIPALLGAVGAAGTVYGNSGSVVQQTPLGGVTTTTNPDPGTKQIAGAAVSGGVQATQQVIQQQAAAIPPKRGEIERYRPIAILFKEDVILR